MTQIKKASHGFAFEHRYQHFMPDSQFARDSSPVASGGTLSVLTRRGNPSATDGSFENGKRRNATCQRRIPESRSRSRRRIFISSRTPQEGRDLDSCSGDQKAEVGRAKGNDRGQAYEGRVLVGRSVSSRLTFVTSELDARRQRGY